MLDRMNRSTYLMLDIGDIQRLTLQDIRKTTERMARKKNDDRTIQLQSDDEDGGSITTKGHERG
jgi:hypothetical protein